MAKVKGGRTTLLYRRSDEEDEWDLGWIEFKNLISGVRTEDFDDA
jgi:hypothetical protein